MDTTILFLHLGMEFHPGKSFTIFGIEIAFYGVIIGLAMLTGALVAYREANKTGQSVDDYIDFTLYTLIAAIVGARLYYVIFEWDYYSKNPAQIFNLRAGGLAIYGGVIASVITLIIFCKVKKTKFFLMADTAIQGLVIGQVIGRWGNFLNREAYGGYTDGLFAMQIPYSEATALNEDILSHIVDVNGVPFIQVQPTFLYEGMWNFALFVFICLYKRHKKFDGEIFFTYLVGYGIGRFIIEGMRTDQLVIKALGGVAVSQILSLLLAISGLAYIIYRRIRLTKAVSTENVSSEENKSE